jgi:hypothetical protein
MIEHSMPIDEQEMRNWLKRVDFTVDVLAQQFGVDVPYQADTEYCRKYGVRYIAPYRLEVLQRKLEERGAC